VPVTLLSARQLLSFGADEAVQVRASHEPEVRRL
jgi:hypothetical protein